jgi:hypothetical protein
MSKFFIAFVFVLAACEEEQGSPYYSEPVLEACTEDLCFSKAVPISRSEELEQEWQFYVEDSAKWPKHGLDYRLHELWCEDYGWRAPTYYEIHSILDSGKIDYYTDVSPDNQDCYGDGNNFCIPAEPNEHYRKITFIPLESDGTTDYSVTLQWTSMYLKECGCIDKFINNPYVYWARCVKSNV